MWKNLPNLGLSNIRKRINVGLTPTKAAPVSTSTSSGTAAVYQPPTVQAPPSAAAAVMQQLNTSDQLAENTATGSGIGAGKSSVAVTVKPKGMFAYIALAALGGALILAYAWDRGAL
jgi:hypothetical protein